MKILNQLLQKRSAMKRIKFAFSNEAVKDICRNLAQTGETPGETIIYDERNRLTTLTLPGNTPLEVNIKKYRCPHWLNSLVYGWFRGSKAKRAFENARQLQRLGISTPEPLAFVEVRNAAGLLSRSYYLCRHLPQYRTLRNIENNPEYDAVIDILAQFLIKLHSAGVWMKDLTPGNVLWHQDISGFRMTLIDINRMEFNVKKRPDLIRHSGTVLDSDTAVKRLAAAYARLSGYPEPLVYDLMMEGYYSRMATIFKKRRLKKAIKKFSSSK